MLSGIKKQMKQVIKTFSMRKLVAYKIGIKRNIGVKGKEARV